MTISLKSFENMLARIDLQCGLEIFMLHDLDSPSKNLMLTKIIKSQNSYCLKYNIQSCFQIFKKNDHLHLMGLGNDQPFEVVHYEIYDYLSLKAIAADNSLKPQPSETCNSEVLLSMRYDFKPRGMILSIDYFPAIDRVYTITATKKLVVLKFDFTNFSLKPTVVDEWEINTPLILTFSQNSSREAVYYLANQVCELIAYDVLGKIILFKVELGFQIGSLLESVEGQDFALYVASFSSKLVKKVILSKENRRQIRNTRNNLVSEDGRETQRGSGLDLYERTIIEYDKVLRKYEGSIMEDR